MTDVTFLYKGRSKVEGKMTDGWEGRDRARERKRGFTLNVTKGGHALSVVVNNSILFCPESFGV